MPSARPVRVHRVSGVHAGSWYILHTKLVLLLNNTWQATLRLSPAGGALWAQALALPYDCQACPASCPGHPKCPTGTLLGL